MKHRNILTILSLTVLLLVQGVAFQSVMAEPKPEPGWQRSGKEISDKIVKKIKKGKTKLNQLTKKLGEPYKIDRTSDDEAIIYVFRHSVTHYLPGGGNVGTGGGIIRKQRNLELRVINDVVIDYNLINGWPENKYSWTEEGEGESS